MMGAFVRAAMAVAIAGAAIVGAAGIAPVATAQDAPKARPFEVNLSPRLILPPEQKQAGTIRSLMPGDEIMRAPLGWLFHGTLAAPVTTEIMGVKIEVGAAETLRRALRYSGGDLAQFGEDAVVYCQRGKTDLVKNGLSALTLGLTDLGTRIAKETQFCLLDADKDAHFDHAFLIGIKKPEDMKAVKIDPVAYVEFTAGDRASHDEGDYVRVVYNRNPGLAGRGINTEFFLGGVRQGNSGYFWWRNNLQTKVAGYGTQTVKRSLPQLMGFANAAIRIKAFNKETKQLDIEYLRDFTYTPLQLQYTTYTYIYY